MEFAVLGPVLVDGRSPRGAIERALLARLLVAPGAPVSAAELIEAGWPQQRRAGAAGSLRVRLAKLRALLEPARVRGAPAEVLVHDPAGYRLVLAPFSVDSERFALGRGGRSAAGAGGARPLRGGAGAVARRAVRRARSRGGGGDGGAAPARGARSPAPHAGWRCSTRVARRRRRGSWRRSSARIRCARSWCAI